MKMERVFYAVTIIIRIINVVVSHRRLPFPNNHPMDGRNWKQMMNWTEKPDLYYYKWERDKKNNIYINDCHACLMDHGVHHLNIVDPAVLIGF